MVSGVRKVGLAAIAVIVGLTIAPGLASAGAPPTDPPPTDPPTTPAPTEPPTTPPPTEPPTTPPTTAAPTTAAPTTPAPTTAAPTTAAPTTPAPTTAAPTTAAPTTAPKPRTDPGSPPPTATTIPAVASGAAAPTSPSAGDAGGDPATDAGLLTPQPSPGRPRAGRQSNAGPDPAAAVAAATDESATATAAVPDPAALNARDSIDARLDGQARGTDGEAGDADVDARLPGDDSVRPAQSPDAAASDDPTEGAAQAEPAREDDPGRNWGPLVLLVALVIGGVTAAMSLMSWMNRRAPAAEPMASAGSVRVTHRDVDPEELMSVGASVDGAASAPSDAKRPSRSAAINERTVKPRGRIHVGPSTAAEATNGGRRPRQRLIKR